MSEKMSVYQQQGSRIEKYGWYAALGGFGVALLGIATGMPVWLNRTASWVGVGGTAAVIGSKVFNRNRK